MTIALQLDTDTASIEQMNDVSFWIAQMVDKFRQPTDLIATGTCVNHNEYRLEYGGPTDTPRLGWNAHKSGTFGRKIHYAIKKGELLPTTLSTYRRLVRLTRDKGAGNSWHITHLDGHDFEGRNINLSQLLGTYIDFLAKKELAHRQAHSDRDLTRRFSKSGDVMFSVFQMANQLKIDPQDCTWEEGVELLHLLQQRHRHYTDQVMHFNYGLNSVLEAL